MPEPCPRGVENCIFFDEEVPRPEPVRMLAEWELALEEWDAQPNGVVGAARPPPVPKNDGGNDKPREKPDTVEPRIVDPNYKDEFYEEQEGLRIYIEQNGESGLKITVTDGASVLKSLSMLSIAAFIAFISQ